LLLLPGLVADGGPQVDPLAGGQGAAHRADQHSQTALLQDVDVVVVGVAHGPARGVPLGVLVVGAVDQAAVAVGPLGEGVELVDARNGAVVDVPVGGRGARVDPARHARGRRGMPASRTLYLASKSRQIEKVIGGLAI
jgi:hypothetical protein